MTFTTSKIPRGFPTTRKPSIRTTITVMPRKILAQSGARIRIPNADGVIARAIFRKIRPPACRLKKIRQLYRDADAILNVCGTQEFNDDLLAKRPNPLHRE